MKQWLKKAAAGFSAAAVMMSSLTAIASAYEDDAVLSENEEFIDEYEENAAEEAVYSEEVSEERGAGTSCVVTSGSNSERQNYSAWATPRRSALAALPGGGLMSVTKDSSGQVIAMYYDSSFRLTGSKVISMSLPIYGGFFLSEDGYYYVASGQQNPSESDSVEVYRITKYDSSWNEISHASLFGANTYIPYDAGSCDFTEDGSYLIVRTCHEMYQSDDGYHHQASVTIQINKSDMSVVCSSYTVANVGYGYVSHSFNQYIRADGGYAVTVDHGDAYPRSVVIGKYNSAINSGIVDGWNKRFTYTNALSIPGSIGANSTGVSVGGFEYSDSAYLIAVNTVDMSGTYSASGTRNAAILVVPKSGSGFGTPVQKNLTNYANGEVSASTPQLVKTGSNSFIMLWSRNGTVYYTGLDGNGNAGSIYSFEGALSDCRPIVYNGNLVWYVYNNEKTVFYKISTSSLSSNSKTEIITGHNYEYKSTTDGVASFICSKCGDVITKTVPTSFVIFGKFEGVSGSYWSNYSRTLTAGGDAMCFLYSYTPGSTDDSTMDVIIDNPRILEYSSSGRKLIPLASGSTNVTFRLRYNPTVQQTVKFTVEGDEPEPVLSGIKVTAPAKTSYYIGDALVLTGGKLTLTYSDGSAETAVLTTNMLSGYDMSRAGSQTVTVTYGGFTDSFKIAVTAKSATDLTISAIADQTYTGSALTPAVTVKDGSKTLTSGTDYTVSYSNNTNVGTATVTVTGKGTYTGTKSSTFKIVAKSISSSTISAIVDQAYTGSALTPAVTVKDGSKTLTSGTDYTVSYSNNTNAGTATVSVTGKGNYTGTKTATFVIVPDYTVGLAILPVADQTYTGSAIKPAVTVKYDGKTLTSGTDYTVSYSNNTAAGTASITVTCKGSYSGKATATFNIVPQNISECTISAIPDKTYTGTTIKPALTIKYGTKTLTVGTSYSVTYKNNTAAGTATVTVTGMKNYTGTATATFKILPRNINECTISEISDKQYTGSEIIPALTIKYGTKTLTAGTSYTVTGKNNIVPGTATVTVTGMKNYTGTRKVTFNIVPRNISDCTISAIPDKQYTGSAITPALTIKNGTKSLTNGTSYSVTYKNNTAVGTATITVTGKKNYTGTTTVTFNIVRRNISSCTISAIADKTYTGSAIKPALTITYGTKTLTAGTSYSVSYKNNTAAGTATVTVTGLKNYTGTATVTFNILPRNISECTISAIPNQKYTGSAIKPALTITYGTRSLTAGTSYSVTYKNNIASGTATITITGMKNYTGTKTITFKIVR